MARSRPTRRPTDATPRVIGYCRVSTDRQAESGAGLEAQRLSIAAECERRGWELAELIVDEGLSAKNLNRPGLTRALETLEAGGADVLMVAKLDRLSRSVANVCQIGDSARFYGWHLVILDSPIDTSSPHGRAQLGMMAVFAELEREMIGQRTREALAVKKAQGVRLGRPVALALQAEALVGSYRAEGLSMQRIADRLNAEGVPTALGARWYASTVQGVLRRVAA